MYYIVLNEQLMKSQNKDMLEAYGATAKVLPDDYEENKYIVQGNELVINPNYNTFLFEKAKEEKLKENDTKRDEALEKGVLYKQVLFDSDTDQKVNILATVSLMREDEKIIWFGKDNQPLECKKEDLLAIGNMIKELHALCWNRNAEVKARIGVARDLEDLDAIDIYYG